MYTTHLNACLVEITLIWHEKYTQNQPKGIIMIISNLVIF